MIWINFFLILDVSQESFANGYESSSFPSSPPCARQRTHSFGSPSSLSSSYQDIADCTLASVISEVNYCSLQFNMCKCVHALKLVFLIYFRYIWHLLGMWRICWQERQLLVGGKVICIYIVGMLMVVKTSYRLMPSCFISDQGPGCGKRCSGIL